MEADVADEELPPPPEDFFPSLSQLKIQEIPSSFPHAPPPLIDFIKPLKNFNPGDQFAENRKAYLNDINCNFERKKMYKIEFKTYLFYSIAKDFMKILKKPESRKGSLIEVPKALNQIEIFINDRRQHLDYSSEEEDFSNSEEWLNFEKK
jgi:hypothetical protein